MDLVRALDVLDEVKRRRSGGRLHQVDDGPLRVPDAPVDHMHDAQLAPVSHTTSPDLIHAWGSASARPRAAATATVSAARPERAVTLSTSRAAQRPLYSSHHEAPGPAPR